MTDRVKTGFEPEGRTIPIDRLLPLRTLPKATRKSSKYQRVAASMSEIGIIEPIVVYPQEGTSGRSQRYLILDGHLRYDILKTQSVDEVFCLISTDDDSFTYNHKVNQISPIQEHFMIMRALENGVSEERIAATLHIDVSAVRKKRDLLEGICPEAVELLKDRRATPGTIREIRRVAPMRQIEMAELMIASNNFATRYAKCLVAATPQEQLVEPERAKEIDGLRPEDVARIEREMAALEGDFRSIEDSHGRNVLNLVLAVGYVRRLLDNAGIVKFLSRKYPDIFGEFEKLAEITDLGPAEG
jgi:hypothetical protein